MKRIITWTITALIVIALASAANAAAKKKPISPAPSQSAASQATGSVIVPDVPQASTKASTKTKKYVTPEDSGRTEDNVYEHPIQAAIIPETPPADEPNVGYKGGFYIKSADSKFKFQVNGRLQPVVYYSKPATSDSVWSFAVQRARMDFSATVFEKATANISINYGTKTAQYTNINLYSATFEYSVAPWLTVSAGTVGMPLGFTASSTAWLTIDPPIAVSHDDTDVTLTTLGSAFGAPDGIGLSLAGDISKFFYVFSAVNGAAEAKPAVQVRDVNGNVVTMTRASGGVESNYDLNFNKKLSAGLRLGYNVLDKVGGAEMDLPYSDKPKLTFSLGGDYQGGRTDPNNSAVVKRILTGAFSGALRWRGFAVNAEFFGRRTKLDSLGTITAINKLSLDDLGYYVNAGYFIVPNKFELAGLISQIVREGPHNNSYQYDGGLNYYFHGNNAKLQLHYSVEAFWNDINDPDPGRTHTVKMMLGSCF